MKKTLLTLSFFLLALVCVKSSDATENHSSTAKLAFAKPQINGPGYNPLYPSTEYTFTSDVDGTWTVAGGTIVSGQGTSVVVVRTDYNPYQGYNNFSVSIDAATGSANVSYFVYSSNGNTPIEW